MKDERGCERTPDTSLEDGANHVGRRVDRNGETLIWCRKSCFTRQRLGPNLMNRCKSEQLGAKEYGKRVLAKNAEGWKVEGQSKKGADNMEGKRRESKRREEERREDRERESQRKRVAKTVREEREEREKREKIHFQCGGALPFLVDVVLCLVHPVNDRVFSLLNRVKYD